MSITPVLLEFGVLNDKISLKLAAYAQDIHDANNLAQLSESSSRAGINNYLAI